MGEILISLFAVIFIVAIIGGIVVRFYQVISSLFYYFFKDIINRHLIFTRLNFDSIYFLETRFRYYQQLSFDDRLLFQRRVQKFMRMKEFVPKGDLTEVTLEMKTLISASAIQITFGLPSIYLAHFHKILVYPDSYYSNFTQYYHQGEVDTRGVIVLSWKNLADGYFDNSDGRNLGLHEMAHALKIADSIKNEEYALMDHDAFHTFIHHARHEMQKIVSGEESFFRSYAAENDYEFFAVAVENFFERPEGFRNYHPELYRLLTELLKQDPLVYQKS